jgi:light-regulated signal transduction histidine kinase (bacteriophytochrome)
MFEIRMRARESRIEAGFGMAACRNIVSQHYGKIEVKSTVAEGINFNITLPLKA